MMLRDLGASRCAYCCDSASVGISVKGLLAREGKILGFCAYEDTSHSFDFRAARQCRSLMDADVVTELTQSGKRGQS